MSDFIWSIVCLVWIKIEATRDHYPKMRHFDPPPCPLNWPKSPHLRLTLWKGWDRLVTVLRVAIFDNNLTTFQQHLWTIKDSNPGAWSKWFAFTRSSFILWKQQGIASTSAAWTKIFHISIIWIKNQPLLHTYKNEIKTFLRYLKIWPPMEVNFLTLWELV